MIKTLIINKEQLIRLGDSEPFYLVENEKLLLDFDTFYNLTNALITLKNNQIKKVLRVVKDLEVPSELIFSGKLEICIDLVSEEKVIKHWDCLPIKIIEHEGKLKCYEEFRAELNALTQRIKALEDAHKIIM